MSPVYAAEGGPKTKTRTQVPALSAVPDGGPALAALTGAAPAHHGPERLQVWPGDLVVDENIRKDTRLTEDFLASLTEHGLLVPIQVRRDPLGQLLVVDGQRRTLGALQVGLPLVDVVVLDGIGDDEARLTAQYVINEQRAALTTKERVDAVQQLSLFGRSPATIKRKLGIPKDQVEAALALAATPTVTATLAEHHVEDLVAGAVIAEFADDPAVVAELAEVAATDPGRLAHRAESVRQDRALEAAKAVVRAELTAAGVAVLEERPRYDDRSTLSLGDLTDKPGATAYSGPAISPDKHASCPGHAAVVSSTYDHSINKHRPHALYYCTDWKSNGHHKRSAANTAGAATGPQSDEKKAERRQLITDNKAADAAEVVRLAWIAEFLQRTTMPADAPLYVGRILALRTSADGGNHAKAREYLWPKKPAATGTDIAERLTTPALATRYLVALAAASVEEVMPRDFHRGDYWAHLHVAHLTTLRSWGYELADVEAAFLEAQTAKAAA